MTHKAIMAKCWKRKREISLEYLTDEKHYPIGTADKYFTAQQPNREYLLTICGNTIILYDELLQETYKGLYHRPFIRTDLLTAGVIQNLRKVTSYAANHEARFVKLITSQNEAGSKRKAAAMNKSIRRLYEDNVLGKIMAAFAGMIFVLRGSLECLGNYETHNLT